MDPEQTGIISTSPTENSVEDFLWSEWSTWSTCTVICGEGKVKRSRKCDQGKCIGTTEEDTTCTGEGGICSAMVMPQTGISCTEHCAAQGTGYICDKYLNTGGTPDLFTALQFNCQSFSSDYILPHSPYYDSTTSECAGYANLPEELDCDAVPTQSHHIRLCNCVDIAVAGMSPWSPWSECSATCSGTRSRMRYCMIGTSGRCDGEGREVDSNCNGDCPVHGGFSIWSSWLDCSATCGGGIRKRVRNCTDPIRSNGGNDCAGLAEVDEICGTRRCPIHGGWTDWMGNGDACTKPCNGGKIERRRYCENPRPLYGGDECPGSNIDATPCNTQPCDMAYVDIECKIDAFYHPDYIDEDSEAFKDFVQNMDTEILTTMSWSFNDSVVNMSVFSLTSGSVDAYFRIWFTSLDEFQLLYIQDSVQNETSLGKISIVPNSYSSFTTNLVPTSAPKDISWTSTSPSTLDITWKPVPIGDTNGVVTGYLVFFKERMRVSDGYDVFATGDLHLTMFGLKPETQYIFRVLAYTSKGNGIATDLTLATTMEDVPYGPPGNLRGESTTPDSIFVEWEVVPRSLMNGEPVGHILYYDNGNTRRNVTVAYPLTYAVIPNLTPSTLYLIEVCALTGMGAGPCDNTEVTTLPAGPTETPTNITSTIRTHSSISLQWIGIDLNVVDVLFYGIQYQLIVRDTVTIENAPIFEVKLSASVTTFEFRLLETNSKYRFTLFGINSDGRGTPVFYEEETCRCPELIFTNYLDEAPYVKSMVPAVSGVLTGVYPDILYRIVDQVCGYCPRGVGKRPKTFVDMITNGKGGYSKKMNEARLAEDIDQFTTLTFPMNGNVGSAGFRSSFAPVLKYPGGVLIVRVADVNEHIVNMILGILKIWPIFFMNALMMILSGGIVWVLEKYGRDDVVDFSRSPFAGIKEGFYWAYVTQTTIGYGDFTPQRVLSRIFAMTWMLIGLVMSGILLGNLATAFTSVQSQPDGKIYGQKVAALTGTFEERLLILRNGKLDQSKVYNTIASLLEALENKDVDGILIDSFMAGEQKSILMKDTVRAAKLIVYPRYSGFVLSGPLANLENAFTDFAISNSAFILSVLEKHTEKMEPVPPPEMISLFDARSETLQNTLKILCIMLVIFMILGAMYWYLYKQRKMRKNVTPEDVPLSPEEQIKLLTEELTEFYKNFKVKIDDLFERFLDDRYRFYVDNGDSSLSNDFKKDNRMNIFTTKHGRFYKINQDQFTQEMKEEKISVPSGSETNCTAVDRTKNPLTFKEAALEVLPKTSIFNLVQNMQGALYIDCLEDFQDNDDGEYDDDDNNDDDNDGASIEKQDGGESRGDQQQQEIEESVVEVEEEQPVVNQEDVLQFQHEADSQV